MLHGEKGIKHLWEIRINDVLTWINDGFARHSCKILSISENLLSLIEQEQMLGISKMGMGHANPQHFFENLLSLIVQEQIWEMSNTAMGHANLQYFWILIISYWTEQMWDLQNGNGSCKSSIFRKTHRLTVRSVFVIK
jgi:hypothetical protein